jgi:hypothetical protein
MLACMAALVPDVLRHLAVAGGFSWTDDELTAIAPLVERSLAALRALQALPLGDAEPPVFFRID